MTESRTERRISSGRSHVEDYPQDLAHLAEPDFEPDYTPRFEVKMNGHSDVHIYEGSLKWTLEYAAKDRKSTRLNSSHRL